MPDTYRINEFLQRELEERRLSHVTAIEAAHWLHEAGLLKDSLRKRGIYLRNLLRAKKITGQRQETNGRWFIDRRMLSEAQQVMTTRLPHTSSMSERRTWNDDELVVAFYLYCVTPFGKIHHNNPQIMEVAKMLGRSPAAISMKMCNFASFDPAHKSRNVGGLKHAGRGDKETWDKYNGHWDVLLAEYEKRMAAMPASIKEPVEEVEPVWTGKRTEVLRTAKARLGQRFFRGTVLASYDNRCAMCQIGVPQLLNASHIIPWSASEERRVDPRNGLSLCGLHDKAFDKGLVTVDEEYRLVLSREIKRRKGPEVYTAAFTKLEGARLFLPTRFAPDSEAIEYHRQKVFVA